MEGGAFAETHLKEFFWPDKCKEIPAKCFYSSYLERIFGTEDIEKIGDRAFSGCPMREFEWPIKCKIIPKGCFLCSELKIIENIDDVEEIQEDAFTAVNWMCSSGQPNVVSFIKNVLPQPLLGTL